MWEGKFLLIVDCLQVPWNRHGTKPALDINEFVCRCLCLRLIACKRHENGLAIENKIVCLRLFVFAFDGLELDHCLYAMIVCVHFRLFAEVME